MTWLSTLESSCLALPSLLMGGSSLMVLAVSSHLSSTVMWAVPRQWLSSGLQWLRVWLVAQWKECLLALLPFWTGPSLEMTNPGLKINLTEARLAHFSLLTTSIYSLSWPFVLRFETCYQIALAIKDEVEDLEKAGINVIQIDEAALREGLPLRKSEQAFYLDWAVHSFRITNCGVKDTSQVHLCRSIFQSVSWKFHWLPKTWAAVLVCEWWKIP